MNHSSSLTSLGRSIYQNRQLIIQMTKRNLIGKYKGSFLGLLWSFINPLIMLSIYTFAFSFVFEAKWGLNDEGHLDFALILFASLTIFNLFSEILKESPSLIVSQPNFVKKVIFPLEILPISNFLSALVHSGISLGIFLIFFGITHLSLPVTLFFLPLVVIPLISLSLGISYILASLGVFLRDIGYLMNHIITILLFTSPVFFSLEKIPPKFRIFMLANPLAYLLEDARSVMIFGKAPNWKILLIYTLLGFLLLMFGYWWFQKTRKGFADVL
ncbi:ABC transporter permease [Leptospira yasudae]|uniref:Transport permease protein n=1 Tax=Leptospira yasudae TaxID=2202201 RepID=A0A5F2AUR1_9LEPT|nr:ABC transporter permease [Leptospira yasudae]TGL77755.1 ABC transporter permease [Leptospira yasudae]TGL81161.1 ABC transporter permease [Leptospira yasudae]TGL82554.1 ABC transporter permease [Leptospira yasudae]TGM95889.1 ABC transporter permease [Leptospira yasudae]